MTDLIERAEAMAERLGRKVHRGQYMPGGGSISSDGTAKYWGGEKIMEYANEDGPYAAALIRELIAQVKADAEPKDFLKYSDNPYK